ncbi:MAG TPA: hypothetical protein PKM25_19650, partial [Candidatus Ozemobacteraceae bacterium]|nr:hypothetical protein [Candidatus Ozemobacteraceae bacterium]
ETSPYRAVAASNGGSLAGLLAYPLLLEPFFTDTLLWKWWGIGVAGWCLLMLSCMPFVSGPREQESAADAPASTQPDDALTGSNPLGWGLPAMAGTALLAAVTNVLTLDVAAIPFLWVIPLAIYLWTWIRAFSETPPDLYVWGRRFPAVLACGFMLAMVIQLGFTLDAVIKGILLMLLLWAVCTVLHGLSAGRRPSDPRRMTAFSLSISAGGFAGTLMTAFGSPLIGTGLVELPLALGLAAVGAWLEKPWKLESGDPFAFVRVGGLLLLTFVLPSVFSTGMPSTGAFLVSATAGAMIYIWTSLHEAARRQMNRAVTAVVIALCLTALDRFGTSGRLCEALRTWYGIYRIFDQEGIRYLQMGSTFHGHEALSGP